MGPFLQTLSSQLEDAFLNLKCVKRWHADYQKAAREILFAGGKQIRPGVFLWALNQSSKPRYSQLELQLALSLEMVHVSTLIKDDMPWMDNDDWRRGLPTAHRVYGECFANLLADVLMLGAFEVVSESELNANSKNLFHKYLLRASGGRGVYSGQWDDVLGNCADLESLHRRKTGALFGACLSGAGVYRGLDREDQLEKLWSDGEKLGVVFQLIDDLLDETATREQLGKTPGKDKWLNKQTALSQWGIEKTKKRIEELKVNLKSYQPWVEFILERKK